MPLQIRVSHALGDGLMDLPDRTLEQPVLIGRSSDCHVQLPSVSVADKHCAFFLHEGQWVVQGIGASGKVLVNGKLLARAARLKIGDVVTVGTGEAAPTIEIDPEAAAAGRTGPAGGKGANLPPAALARSPRPSSATATDPTDPAPHRLARPPAVVPVAPPVEALEQRAEAWEQPGEALPLDEPPPAEAAAAYPPEAWAEPAAEPQGLDALQAAVTSVPSYARPQKSTGGKIVPIVVTVVFAGGILSATAWFVMNFHPKTELQTRIQKVGPDGLPMPEVEGLSPPDTNPSPTTRRVKTRPAVAIASVAPVTRPAEEDLNPIDKGMATPENAHSKYLGLSDAALTTRMADVGKSPGSGKGPATRPAADKAIASATAAGKSMANEMTAKPTTVPVAPEPEPKPNFVAGSWEEMEYLNRVSREPAIAIFRFEDYRRINMGKKDAELDTFVEKKLDQIWWERIAALFARRDSLASEMAKKQKQIWDQNNLEEKKKQVAEVSKMDKEKKQTSDILRNTMGYASDKPPDLSSEGKLAELATKRDAANYTNWKRITLKFIIDNKGKLPWEGK